MQVIAIYRKLNGLAIVIHAIQPFRKYGVTKLRNDNMEEKFKGTTLKIIACYLFQINMKTRINSIEESLYLFSAQKGDCEQLQQYIDQGGDIHVKDAFGWSALQFSAMNGHFDAVDLLLRSGAEFSEIKHLKLTELMVAAAIGDTDLVEHLCEKTNDINLTDWQGNTALIYASLKGHLNCVQVLIQHGADLDVQNEYHPSFCHQQTALMLASSKGYLDVTQCLISNGASVNLRNAFGETAAIIASEKGHVECVRELLASGADGNMQDKWKRSALMAAVQNGHISTVSLLCSHGVDQNVCDIHGFTPLMWATRLRKYDCVSVLLSHGGDPSITNEEGHSSFNLAANNNLRQMLQTPIHAIKVEVFYSQLNQHWDKIDLPSIYLLTSGSSIVEAFHKIHSQCGNLWKCTDHFEHNLTAYLVQPANDMMVVLTLRHFLKGRAARCKHISAIKFELFQLHTEDPKRLHNVKEIFNVMEKICRSGDPKVEIHVCPCDTKVDEKDLSPSCFINCNSLKLPTSSDQDDEVKYGSAVCFEHKTYVQGAIMSKWFDCKMSKNEHRTEKAHNLRNNLVERFLRSVSKLITDEVLFIDIGVELDLKWDEIKTIRTDNPNSIVNAGYQALQEWRNKIQTNDITVIKETLLEAFTTCKVGSQFQQVAQKFEL